MPLPGPGDQWGVCMSNGGDWDPQDGSGMSRGSCASNLHTSLIMWLGKLPLVSVSFWGCPQDLRAPCSTGDGTQCFSILILWVITQLSTHPPSCVV